MKSESFSGESKENSTDFITNQNNISRLDFDNEPRLKNHGDQKKFYSPSDRNNLLQNETLFSINNNSHFDNDISNISFDLPTNVRNSFVNGTNSNNNTSNSFSKPTPGFHFTSTQRFIRNTITEKSGQISDSKFYPIKYHRNSQMNYNSNREITENFKHTKIGEERFQTSHEIKEKSQRSKVESSNILRHDKTFRASSTKKIRKHFGSKEKLAIKPTSKSCEDNRTKQKKIIDFIVISN